MYRRDTYWGTGPISNKFGGANGPILRVTLPCDGTESSIQECTGILHQYDYCSHYSDVGVRCEHIENSGTRCIMYSQLLFLRFKRNPPVVT